MSLIWGINSITSCPWCLVKTKDFGDPSAQAKLQMSTSMQEIIKEAKQEELIGKREEILKPAGLRDIEVSYNYFYSVCILTTFLRTYFGGSVIQTHIGHYHLTGFIPSLVVFSRNISGHAFNNM